MISVNLTDLRSRDRDSKQAVVRLLQSFFPHLSPPLPNSRVLVQGVGGLCLFSWILNLDKYWGWDPLSESDGLDQVHFLPIIVAIVSYLPSAILALHPCPRATGFATLPTEA